MRPQHKADEKDIQQDYLRDFRRLTPEQQAPHFTLLLALIAEELRRLRIDEACRHLLL